MSNSITIALILIFLSLCLVYFFIQWKLKQFEQGQQKLKEDNLNLEKNLILAEEKYKSLDKQLLQNDANYKTQTDLLLKRGDIEIQTLKQEHNTEKDKLNQDLNILRSEKIELEKRIENAIVTFKHQDEKLQTQSKELEQLQQKFKIEFENIANKLFEEKSQKFTEQNKTNLDAILHPLKERIKEFEDKVDKSYKQESNERVSLKTQIEQLTLLNQQLNKEAANLTKALTKDNKKQGGWGEIILEKILESSGLKKGVEYTTQSLTYNEDESRIKPDVIIHLPDNKHLIIDSKVSLTAYYQMISEEQEEEERTKYKNLHLQSVRSHIKLLSEKKYETAEYLNAPDFVLLFLPIESSFALAVQEDDDLFNFAWERKIVLVSPSTLLATLRTIAATWKQEKQTKHAYEIAKEAGNMLEKLVAFVEDIEKIGEQIDRSKSAYDAAHNKLVSGKGNLINRAKKIQDLGAKSDKLKQLDHWSSDENS